MMSWRRGHDSQGFSFVWSLHGLALFAVNAWSRCPYMYLEPNSIMKYPLQF